MLEMRVRNRDERARGARCNQQLERRRFRIDLNVIEARNLSRHGFAQVGDAFGWTVMISAGLDYVARRLGQLRIDRELGLSLDEIPAWWNESSNGSDFRLNSLNCAMHGRK